MNSHNPAGQGTAGKFSKSIEIGTFPDRLRQVIEKRSVRSFARHCGMSDSVLRQYLKGKSEPTRPVLLAIACCTGVSVEWLATGTGPMKIPDQRATLQLTEGDFCSIPLVAATKDETDSAPISRVPSNLIFRSEWLKKELSTDPQALAMTVAHGNAMEPAIGDGDTLLVNIRQNRVHKDGIYVLQTNSAMISRRIQVLMDGGLHVTCDNPTYAPQTISHADADSLTVVGRVVWIGKKLL